MKATCLQLAVAMGLRPGQETAEDYKYSCPMPGHPDQHPSCRFSRSEDKDVWHCDVCNEGGGPAGLICARFNIDPSDKKAIAKKFEELGFPSDSTNHKQSDRKPKTTSSDKKVVHKNLAFHYRKLDGSVRFREHRMEYEDGSKRIFYSVPDDNGGWKSGKDCMKGVKLVPYALERWYKKRKIVFVVEGPKKAARLLKWGFGATCTPYGAGKWKDEYAEWFKGKHVVVCPDNDEPGRDHANDIIRGVLAVAKSVRLLELPNLPEKGDVCDWIESGGTKKEFAKLANAAKAVTEPPYQDNSSNDDRSEYGEEIAWPAPLDQAALRGRVGEIVRVISPHTEADDASLVLTTVITFGSIIGRSAYFLVNGTTKHYTNLFGLLVGRSSMSRKGEAESQIENIFKRIDEDYVSSNIRTGASTGEGIIHHVRDARYERSKKAKEGVVCIDEGVDDKRLLDFEPEFVRILKMAIRPESILSVIFRDAWDSRRPLENLNKNSHEKATDAHISIIGHITKDELLKYLDETEVANGFANRFLWFCVKRSKELPEGGALDPDDLEHITKSLGDAIEFARRVKEVKFTDEASALWKELYSRLTAEHDGLIGAITARAAPLVIRLALIYALLDKSGAIKRSHLKAAMAIWNYAEQSCEYIFGRLLGDSVADGILAALRRSPEGLTKTEIVDLFHRHKNVSRGLELLLKRRLVECRIEKTEGRPAERWLCKKK